jgi:hypothetical protein
VLVAIIAELFFVGGIVNRNYWAIAIPVGVVFTFVMSLVIWIGWTIMTVPTDASGDPLPTQGSPSAAANVEADDSTEQA